MRLMVMPALLVALAGCAGWRSAPPTVQDAIREYRDARLAGDAARTCAALSAAMSSIGF